ncbi:hypothetical protein Tco_1456845 [Tanacetum coccineum]
MPSGQGQYGQRMSGPPPQMMRGPPPARGGPPRMSGPPPVGARPGMPPPGVFGPPRPESDASEIAWTLIAQCSAPLLSKRLSEWRSSVDRMNVMENPRSEQRRDHWSPCPSGARDSYNVDKSEMDIRITLVFGYSPRHPSSSHNGNLPIALFTACSLQFASLLLSFALA